MIEKALISLLGSIYLLLIPIYPLIFLVGLFILTDTIIGIYTSWKLGNPIVSRKLSRLISKLFVYTSVILLVFTLDKIILSYFIGGFIITKISAGVLCFIEGFSIDENMKKINNNKGIVHYMLLFYNFIKGFKDKFNKIINE